MPIPEVSPSPAEVDALLKKLGLDASDLPEPPGGLALEAIRLGNELAVVRAKLASACSFQQGALAMRNRVVNYLQGRAVALGQRADWTERKDADNPFADRIVEEIRELVVGLDSEANTIQTFDPEKESAVEQGVGLIYREHERQPTRGTMTTAESLRWGAAVRVRAAYVGTMPIRLAPNAARARIGNIRARPPGRYCVPLLRPASQLAHVKRER